LLTGSQELGQYNHSRRAKCGGLDKFSSCNLIAHDFRFHTIILFFYISVYGTFDVQNNHSH
jgi:hypothetical protein